MTDQEINVAIAEACGALEVCEECGGCLLAPPPDYCHDLNAMHEAEKLVVQAGGTWTGYISSLHETSLVENCSMIWHATARQRAEALLRTIGKWRDKTI